MKIKYFFILPIFFFLFGSGLIIAALWPSQVDQTSQKFQALVDSNGETLAFTGYQLVYEYTPSMKAGIQSTFLLNLQPFDQNSVYNTFGLWDGNKVELVVHLEASDPSLNIEPYGHVHIPWKAGGEVTMTWNMRSDFTGKVPVRLWIYVRLLSFNDQDDGELPDPQYGIKLTVQITSILGMRADLAVVIGGIAIFMAIVLAALISFFKYKRQDRLRSKQRTRHIRSSRKKMVQGAGKK